MIDSRHRNPRPSNRKLAHWQADPQRYVLITGGAGFVGTNLADRLLSQGQRVVLMDTLERPGVERNMRWLTQKHPLAVTLLQKDVRDAGAVTDAVGQAAAVFHFAAQVAVTTSMIEPVEDFEINARGTLNVLEAIRRSDHQPPLLFTSTNKVYGPLDHLPLRQTAKRYEPVDPVTAARGVDETDLDFHGPYGCSKGAADQYVLDYARTFNLRSTVFRMSCIYGPHQHGNEDQGWVAHFLRCALAGSPITLYGNGKQVRDLLFVQDLVDAMLLAMQGIEQLAGRAYNIGGGPAQTVSLIELTELIGQLIGRPPHLTFNQWRLGDQRYYVSDVTRFSSATGWQPRVTVQQGVQQLYHWLQHVPSSHNQASFMATPTKDLLQ